jgi:hypothetical protein
MFWVDETPKEEASFARENAVALMDRHLFWGRFRVGERKDAEANTFCGSRNTRGRLKRM